MIGPLLMLWERKDPKKCPKPIKQYHAKLGKDPSAQCDEHGSTTGPKCRRSALALIGVQHPVQVVLGYVDCGCSCLGARNARHTHVHSDGRFPRFITQ